MVTPGIPAPRRQRHSSFGYRVRPCLKVKKIKKEGRLEEETERERSHVVNPESAPVMPLKTEANLKTQATLFLRA